MHHQFTPTSSKPMQSIKANGYSVIFNLEGYKELNKQISENNYSTLFIIVDSITNEVCLPKLLPLIETDSPIEIIEFEAGEINKNIDTCIQIWNVLTELGADRKSLIINLGGGVVSDLGGFVASTFKRGIDFINIPTTLLAMVDASIGGKTGIDLGNLKNQIGVINNPKLVLIDSDFLATLPQIEMRSGLAEISVKKVDAHPIDPSNIFNVLELKSETLHYLAAIIESGFNSFNLFNYSTSQNVI